MNVLRLVQRELPKIVDKNSFIDMRKLKWVFFYFIYIYMYMVEGHIEAVLSEFNICRHFQM
jgi:hypothetical protein